MSAQLQPRDQDEYVLVRRTRIAALSRALGNPTTVEALEGDTVEDCLVEIAAKRLTFIPRRQVVATSITHNGAHVGNVFTDRDHAHVRMRTLNKNHPDDRRELVDLVPAGTFDMLQHLERQRAFSEQTFGPGMRTQGVIDHIRKELLEIEAAPTDLSEWIDVAILALDGAWRTGATPQQIIEALVAKQAKNEARQWPDWRTVPVGQAIEHVRAKPSGPLEDSNDPVAGQASAAEDAMLGEMFRAWHELRGMGWLEMFGYPDDGTVVEVITAGSTGVHDAKVMNGSWWVLFANDLWPAHPILWRPKRPAD